MISVRTIKNVVTGIVGYGIHKVVQAVIDNNTEPENIKDKFGVKVGKTALTVMAVTASKEYTDKKIDAYYQAWIKVQAVRTKGVDEICDDKKED